LSQVARIYTGRRIVEVIPGNIVETLFERDFEGVAVSDDNTIFIKGETEFAVNSGSTGEATLDLSMIGLLPIVDFRPADWRARTIGIRMQPKAIPTLSEWGFLAFAAALGLAGIFVLRRRQAVKT
jgi:hypothetical protein